jgi:hypothetical protein
MPALESNRGRIAAPGDGFEQLAREVGQRRGHVRRSLAAIVLVS